MSLVTRWTNLVSVHFPSVSSKSIDDWWNRIESYYSEEQRYYHKLSHIEAMFRYYTEVEALLEKPLLVSFAIFFHDIIYQPKNSDNEEKSAELFKEFANEINMNESDSDIVFQWIIDTKAHKGIPGNENNDLNLFIDMDLSIFGASREDYIQYTKDIRQEYIHYNDDAFRKGRAHVMKHFLPSENEFIFKSQYFIDKLEKQAINNIKWEIEELEQ